MTMGHVYLIILVMFCQAAVFKEISALFDVAAKPVHTHHHHHHSRNGSTAEKAISPTRAARDARAKAERERWSKVTSW
jgi:phosphatidate cytidylyltransferase